MWSLMSAPSQRPAATTPRRLAILRQRIDAIDQRLILLLAKRAALALEAAEVKRRADLPIYAPAREREVIARAKASASAPLTPAAMAPIFRAIILACRAAEAGATPKPRPRGSRQPRGRG